MVTLLRYGKRRGGRKGEKPAKRQLEIIKRENYRLKSYYHLLLAAMCNLASETNRAI